MIVFALFYETSDQYNTVYGFYRYNQQLYFSIILTWLIPFAVFHVIVTLYLRKVGLLSFVFLSNFLWLKWIFKIRMISFS